MKGIDVQTENATSADRMQCMEVWGGNSSTDRHFHVPGLEVWLRSRPFENAPSGGDVYYVSSCASGRVTRLLLADVCGHGSAVSNISHSLRALMRKNINFVKQDRFVEEMNRQFSKQAQLDCFATAVVCSFFEPTRSLELSNAGHPDPYVYRSQTGEWNVSSEIEMTTPRTDQCDTPLGVIDDADYSCSKTRLSQGDMVLCVSDAYIEAWSVDERMLGMQGLLDIIRGLDMTRPATFLTQLETTVRDLNPLNLQQDDATSLLFRSDGTSPTISDNLLAPLRLLTRVRDTQVTGSSC